MDALPKLAALEPKFMTVTYGAGGSTREGTLSLLRQIMADYSVPVGSHLTFLTSTKAELDSYIDALWDEGVRHIVALRGDLPKGRSFDEFTGSEYYDYTSNFVLALREKHPFEISVAAYPEKHPDAPSMEADIEALRLKCEAGATRAITQFFFDNEAYFRFVDECAAKGITTPICPGLLPIHNFDSMMKFANSCQAYIPVWLQDKFGALSDGDEAGAQALATEILVKQAEELVGAEVPHIHFYALNRDSITTEACRAIARCNAS